MVNKSEWEETRKKHEKAVKLFNDSKKAVPYIGIILKFKYCPVCGAKIEWE
jgi:hypothetical protein